ncbi:MAG: cyclic di-GMP phosphodiesterase [Solirubrobacteraceae bacterium]|nr:cyclic di-GMP phosphodiesterase [Solirubrobacteraceae bacterium]
MTLETLTCDGSRSLATMRIMLVDDHPANLDLAQQVLGGAGYTCVSATRDPAVAVRLCQADCPDVLLLDLHMPELDGFEVLARLRTLIKPPVLLPVCVLTADVSTQSRRRALSLGARDFLTKPFDPVELLVRVRNLLETRHLQIALQRANASLSDDVLARTIQLEAARFEMIERLARAGEYRDDDTQRHASRIGRRSALLARRMGIGPHEAELITHAAPLHDVGKIGVSDTILLKPGALTPAERALMQRHAAIGARLLSGGSSDILRMAERIARSHHERFDGAGYPDGLAGDAIPLVARIVAIVDVFDALTHERPYKRAWPIERALTAIRSERGRHFDPAVVDAFLTLDLDELVDLDDEASRGLVAHL